MSKSLTLILFSFFWFSCNMKNHKAKETILRLNGDTMQKTVYYPNGRPEFIFSYVNDELSGPCYSFFENGQIESIRNYKNGKKNGSALFFFPDGNLKEKYLMLEDSADIIYQSFYKSGFLKELTPLANGKKMGISRVFYDSSIHIRRVRILKNDSIFFDSEMDTNGKIISKFGEWSK